MSILIAVATAHNTTRDIAQRIATRLGTHTQVRIDVLDVAEIPAGSVPKYSAIIVGSAVHAQSWLSPARKFIHSERLTLTQRPVWAYSVGVPSTEAYAVKEEEKIGNDVRNEIPGLRGHVLFRGRIEREHLPWPVSPIFKWFPNVWKFGDFVEWDKVDAWADEVGREIGN